MFSYIKENTDNYPHLTNIPPTSNAVFFVEAVQLSTIEISSEV